MRKRGVTAVSLGTRLLRKTLFIPKHQVKQPYILVCNTQRVSSVIIYLHVINNLHLKKIISHLTQRFFPTLKLMVITSLTRVLPDVFRIPGLCFRCTRVSFPKTFKTENRKMSGNSIRYPCTVKYL